ncbi:MAG: GNAT family N-acetyltransferase [Deltaproteobacteria bacterium]|nr:GNAT family N-acetyltransferase [Deltaproteobacteria bacterium]
MHIHQLSVDSEYRRKGVGRRLMYALDNVARENGISKFVLDSWEFNKESHTFFEQLGYSCIKINMWRETVKD